MKRFIIDDLIDWKNDKNKKPLIICGARQVGKSWLIENELSSIFLNNFVKIDFSQEYDMHQFFKYSKDPYKIIENISLALGKKLQTKL